VALSSCYIRAYLSGDDGLDLPGVINAQAGPYFMDPTGTNDAGPALQLAVTAAGGAGGGIVFLGVGTPKISTGVSFPSGVEVVGAGYKATRIINNCVGDMFTMDSVDRCAVRMLTIDAASVRSAGYAVRIIGGTDDGGLMRSQHVIDVDMNNQYDGVFVEDEDSSNPAWHTMIGNPDRMALWKNFAAGRYPYTLNTPYGAGHFVKNLWIYGNATPANGSYGLRIQGFGDVTIEGVSTWGCLHGLLVDPQTIVQATVGLLQCSNSIFDFSENECFRFNPSDPITGVIVGMFNNVWFATSRTKSNIRGSNGATHQISFNGCSFLNAAAYGLRGDTGCDATTFKVNNGNFGPPLTNASGTTSYV
jgi:hypothetical protein